MPKTQHAVNAMIESSRRVEIGVEFSIQAGAALGNIVTSVSSLQSMIGEISVATEEMSVTSEQTNRDVVNLSTISNEAATCFEKILRLASNVTELSKKLQNKVGQFRIDGG